MTTTMDFEEWLANAELDGHEEVDALYQAVRGSIRSGLFSVVPIRGAERWLVSAPHVDQRLLLASAPAREAFLTYLEREHCGEMEIEEWLGYEQAAAKEN